jgi:hypothetical protein
MINANSNNVGVYSALQNEKQYKQYEVNIIPSITLGVLRN